MTYFRKLIKRITHPILKTGLKLYYNKPRKYKYKGIIIIIHPDVFPPQLTLSTKILLDYISDINLKEKTFLELGCGSGIISLFANKKGAKVTASDINKTALEYLEKASIKNNLKLSIIFSDLFKNIENTSFDYIFINPPYYPKNAKNIKEKAWFCGENFEYFEKLFQQLSKRTDKNIFMILSVDCDLTSIQNIARNNRLKLTSIFEKSVFGECNFIFEITTTSK